jgi:hypothetical protein
MSRAFLHTVGAMFATTVLAGASDGLPYGVARLLAGLVFSLGLILVIVGGAELFTGNNLIVMAWASRKVSTAALVQNWLVVYLGNFAVAVEDGGQIRRRWRGERVGLIDVAARGTRCDGGHVRLLLAWRGRPS